MTGDDNDSGLLTRIAKSPSDRIVDLANSLCLLRDSIELYDEGRLYQLAAISSQLRILVADRKPLLATVSEYENKDIKLYRSKKTTKPDFLEEKEVFAFDPVQFSLEKSEKNNEEQSLIQFLNTGVLIKAGAEETIVTLIKYYAEKLGGAHSDEKIPAHLILLRNIGGRSVDHYLVDIGRVISEIAAITLSDHLDFSVHICLIFITTSRPASILSIGGGPGQSKLSIETNESDALSLKITGLDGSIHTFTILKSISHGKPEAITITGRVDKKGGYQIDIWRDGETPISHLVKSYPLFLNKLNDMEIKINDHNPPAQGEFEFALGPLLSISRALEKNEVENFQKYSASRIMEKNSKLILIKNDTLGRSKKEKVKPKSPGNLIFEPKGILVLASTYIKS